MSNEDGYAVAEAYTAIDAMEPTRANHHANLLKHRSLFIYGTTGNTALKLEDKGLFDGDTFSLL